MSNSGKKIVGMEMVRRNVRSGSIDSLIVCGKKACYEKNADGEKNGICENDCEREVL